MRQALIEKNIERYDNYIEKADNKASFLLAFYGALLIGIILESNTIYTEIIKNNALRNIFIAILIIEILTIIYSIKSSLDVIIPRTPKTRNMTTSENVAYESLLYFNDVKEYYGKDDKFIKKLEKCSDQEIIEDMTIQSIELANICSSKMEKVQRLADVSRIINIETVVLLMIIILDIVIRIC